MLDWSNTTIFSVVLTLYFLSMSLGVVLGRRKFISVATLAKIGQKMGDPWTTKIHNWSRQYKIISMQRGNWPLLLLLIFLNNLLLVAFVSRVLYGVVFFIPLLLTAWTGFSQGVVFSKPQAWAGIPLILFEMAGYLCATVVGVRIGLDLLTSLLLKRLAINIPWGFVHPVLWYIFIGALIETLSLRATAKQVDLSNIEQLDFSKRRQELAEELDGE